MLSKTLAGSQLFSWLKCQSCQRVIFRHDCFLFSLYKSLLDKFLIGSVSSCHSVDFIKTSNSYTISILYCEIPLHTLWRKFFKYSITLSHYFGYNTLNKTLLLKWKSTFVQLLCVHVKKLGLEAVQTYTRVYMNWKRNSYKNVSSFKDYEKSQVR